MKEIIGGEFMFMDVSQNTTLTFQEEERATIGNGETGKLVIRKFTLAGASATVTSQSHAVALNIHIIFAIL